MALKDTALWVNMGYTSLENDNINTAYDGRALTALVGVDTRPIDPVTVGIAFGFENVDLDTTFNRGNQEWNGYTGTVYGVYRFLRNYSVDASASYSRLDTDVSRLNSAATGSYDSDRLMGAVNVNGNWGFEKWRFGATVGYLYLHQEDAAYFESGLGNNRVSGNIISIGQGRAGVKLGYDFGQIEPYVKGRVEHEFISPGTQFVGPGVFVSPDTTGFVVGLGANLRVNDRLTGTVEATTNQGREDQEIWGISGTLRFRF
jgi:outer membrane autotransporter protein